MSEKDELMSVWEHLERLRKRLIKSLIALIITTSVSFSLGKYYIELLTQPIGGIDNLQSIEITENIGVFMRVSLLSGFILALPFILYQILAFVFVGLKRNEKKWILITLPLATILFLSGVCFAFLIMLPTTIPFLVGFLDIQTTPRLSSYINFVTSLLFWIGISFELPLVVFILAKLKLVNAKILAKQWRIALVIISVVAAVVSPTIDPVNMALLMIPLFALYLLSVLLAILA